MSKLPNTLIIGAQKGGSTWLYDILRNHPEVYLPEKVELLHFSKADCNSEIAKEKYSAHFESVQKQHKIIAEKTPSYLWTYAQDTEDSLFSPAHNKNLVDDVKSQLGGDINIILSLRHPVTRVISAFFHHAKRGRFPLNSSFNDSEKFFGMLDIGFYARHLKEWLKRYPKEQILTLIMERDIISSPNTGCEKLSNFLNISDFPEKINMKDKSNKGVSKYWDGDKLTTDLEGSPYISKAEILKLLEFYKEDMDELRNLLGDELKEWSKIDDSLREFCSPKLPIADKYNVLSNSESIYGLNSHHSVMLELGIDLSALSSKMSSNQVVIEPPVRLSNAIAMHHSSIGAFTYFTSGYIYNTQIGRYCSVARDVNIGQGNHPMDWLSTSPFQYETGFKFKAGKLFEHDIAYKDMQIPEGNRAKALDSIRKPLTRIGNDVWIGHGVIISAGVSIGNGAIVGAGSVVTKDVPDYAIVAGTPAKILKYRFSDEIIDKLVKSKWWQYSPWALANVNFSDVSSALDEISKLKASMQLLPYSSSEISIGDIRALQPR